MISLIIRRNNIYSSHIDSTWGHMTFWIQKIIYRFRSWPEFFYLWKFKCWNARCLEPQRLKPDRAWYKSMESVFRSFNWISKFRYASPSSMTAENEYPSFNQGKFCIHGLRSVARALTISFGMIPDFFLLVCLQKNIESPVYGRLKVHSPTFSKPYAWNQSRWHRNFGSLFWRADIPSLFCRWMDQRFPVSFYLPELPCVLQRLKPRVRHDES